MVNRRPFYRHGFTIVELLVAVVVIAVLASITVVAYNNVQQRAYSAKVISAVDTYVKALKIYHIQNGRFPSYGTTWGACLGGTAQYPALQISRLARVPGMRAQGA